MIPKVIRLIKYREKGDFGTEVLEAEFLEGSGMDGNMFQGGERQISLLSVEARQWMEAQKLPGLCFERYKENILTEGIPLENLRAGSRLAVGDAVLRISAEKKKCHIECELFIREMSCFLSKCAIFAVVEQSGYICVGAPVRVL